MADAPPNNKLRQYLLELKPEARSLLASELERALLRGEEPPGASAILEQLRKTARREGRKLPRVGNPQRLFFVAVEPFLVDDAPERKHLGRIARASLDPIWKWICRDLMLREARSYSDQVQLLLAANEKSGADQVARAFQNLAEQRLRECLASIKKDEKALQRVAGQIGTPHAIEEVRELAAILRARDALGVIGSRLPPTISNLADEQLENVRALLDSPIGRHRDVFLYALLIVMSRLGSPWQLIRLAIHAAASDVADAYRRDAVCDRGRCRARPTSTGSSPTCATALKAADSDEVGRLLKDFHDAARALHTEIELPADSTWGRQLASARADVATLLEGEIDNLPGQVRRLLRPRNGQGDATARARCQRRRRRRGEARAGRGLPQLRGRARGQRGDAPRALRAAELFRQRHRRFCSTGCGPRRRPSARCRQSQVDAAVRFCAKLFGAEYAEHARQGRRRCRQGRAEGRKGLISNAISGLIFRIAAVRARDVTPP